MNSINESDEVLQEVPDETSGSSRPLPSLDSGDAEHLERALMVMILMCIWLSGRQDRSHSEPVGILEKVC
jgi:hypothetical protein